MKRILYITIFTTFLFGLNSYGQACGSGTYYCQFISSDYKILTNLKYEFLPLKKDVLTDSEFENKYRSIYYGIPLSKDEAKGLVSNSHDLSKLKGLTTCLKKSGLDSIGMHNSNFEFHTFELLYHPLILKITSDNENYYFLGNFFGGCNRQNVFVLNHTSLDIRSDVNLDGYYDFVNLTGVEQLGGKTFDVYLYDPLKKTYQYAKEYSESTLEKSEAFYEDWNISHIVNKIYSLYDSTFLVIQNFVSGNGNHYYDNILVSHISVSNQKIEYLPFHIKNEELKRLKSKNGSIEIAQHQGFNYQDKMVLTYNEKTKIIEVQFTKINTTTNTGKKINMKFKLIDNRFQTISESLKTMQLD